MRRHGLQALTLSQLTDHFAQYDRHPTDPETLRSARLTTSRTSATTRFRKDRHSDTIVSRKRRRRFPKTFFRTDHQLGTAPRRHCVFTETPPYTHLNYGNSGSTQHFATGLPHFTTPHVMGGLDATAGASRCRPRNPPVQCGHTPVACEAKPSDIGLTANPECAPGLSLITTRSRTCGCPIQCLNQGAPPAQLGAGCLQPRYDERKEQRA
jgi:hypothetical protein